MKKLLAILIFIAASAIGHVAQAQTPDSIWVARSLQQVQKENARLQQTVERLSRQVKYLSERVSAVERASADSVAQIGAKVAGVQSDLDRSASGLTDRLNDIDQKVELGTASSNTKSRTALLWAVIGTLLVAALGVVGFVILRKRLKGDKDSLDKFAAEAETLRQSQVDLDSKLTAVLEKQLEMVDKAGSSDDHSLVLSIINEMARIDQNLQFMDPKTKGVSQLRNRSKAISEALKKKGYEMPALIGTEYKEGYNMEASVEEDDTVEPGKMIIKRINRPAVLFNGRMIQAAKVVVAFNPEEE